MFKFNQPDGILEAGRRIVQGTQLKELADGLGATAAEKQLGMYFIEMSNGK